MTFLQKTEILNGFTMNGILDLGGHSILDVHVPNGRDDAVTTKKYCYDNFLSNTTGFTMQGDINMANNKITNLPDPTSDREPVTKKFADIHYSGTGHLSVNGFTMQGYIDMYDNKIINLPTPISDTEPATKAYSDNKFVTKTSLTTAEWLWAYNGVYGGAYGYPYTSRGWPAPVRTDELTNNSNIELRHITFDDELTKAKILTCTLVVSFRYDTVTSFYESEILNLPLAGKTVLEIPTNVDTTTYTLPLEEEYWLGGLIPSTRRPLAFTVKIKLTGITGSIRPEVTCTFRLNEAGRYG